MGTDLVSNFIPMPLAMVEFRERERERVYIEGADADDLLRCSATVGNLGERGEPDILT